MRQYLLYSFFIFIFVLLESSCITAKIYKNDWMNKKYTTKEFSFDDVIELKYMVVPNNKKAKYIALLREVSFLEIDKTEYENITGKVCEKKYALAIRAVYTNLGGNFYVLYSKSDLEIVVDYCVLGYVYGVHKTVLFIEVDDLPRYIYVDYSGAI